MPPPQSFFSSGPWTDRFDSAKSLLFCCLHNFLFAAVVTVRGKEEEKEM
jgi:hypothetical protein